MTFLLPCPNCGARDVNEFAYQGELTKRPKESPTFRELTSYLYFRENVAGGRRGAQRGVSRQSDDLQ